MQRFAVSLTIASVAVALNLNDGDEPENMILGLAEPTFTLAFDDGEPSAEAQAGEEEEAVEAGIFDADDQNGDGIPDIFQRVVEKYVLEPVVEDCSCLLTHGMPITFNEFGAFIVYEYVDFLGETITLNYPANYGLTQCSAWDEFLPDFCADEFGVAFEDAPQSCRDSWCWVNSETCMTGVEKSAYFPDAGLYYSYEACAADDEAEEEGEAEEEAAEEAEEEAEALAEGQEEADEGEEETTEPVELEEDCSCITTFGGNPTIEWTPEGVHYVEVDLEEDTYQYPPNYGLSGCQAWDADLEPFCADAEGMPLEDAPVWCANQWCYVNPATCTSPKVRQSTNWLDAELFYSYEACGDVDVFGDEGELCPGVAISEDSWWNKFLTNYICPNVMERLDAEFEAAKAEEAAAAEDEE